MCEGLGGEFLLLNKLKENQKIRYTILCCNVNKLNFSRKLYVNSFNLKFLSIFIKKNSLKCIHISLSPLNIHEHS